LEPSPSRLERVSRLLVVVLLFAAAVELLVARGALFVRHERLRAGLPATADFWWTASSYVTTFTGLLAAAAVVALGLRLATSRLSPAGRGLALGFAATIAALAVAALFVSPQVRGILTIHLAVALGGLMLGTLVFLSAADAETRLAAVLPLILPPLGTAAFTVWRSPGLRAIAATVLWVAGAAVAAGLAWLAWRRARRGPRLRMLAALAYALGVAVLAAGAAALEPRRVVEFVLFSHGVLLDFRRSLVVFSLALLAVSFAAAVFVATPTDEAAGRPSGERLGFGLLLCLLAGPAPLNVTQSLVLAAGTMARVESVVVIGPAQVGAGGPFATGASSPSVRFDPAVPRPVGPAAIDVVGPAVFRMVGPVAGGLRTPGGSRRKPLTGDRMVRILRPNGRAGRRGVLDPSPRAVGGSGSGVHSQTGGSRSRGVLRVAPGAKAQGSARTRGCGIGDHSAAGGRGWGAAGRLRTTGDRVGKGHERREAEGRTI